MCGKEQINQGSVGPEGGVVTSGSVWMEREREDGGQHESREVRGGWGVGTSAQGAVTRQCGGKEGSRCCALSLPPPPHHVCTPQTSDVNSDECEAQILYHYKRNSCFEPE